MPPDNERPHERIEGAVHPDEAPALRVIELPPEGPPGIGWRRPHHALSMSSETPKAMLRSIGVPASNCSTRVRVPSSLHQTSDGITYEGRAEVGLACRF